jgi:hypothetical protein
LWRCRNHFPKSIDVIAELHPTTWYGIIHLIDLNRLTAMVADMRPLFFELRMSLITFRIFVRCQRLIARNVADGFLLYSLADMFIRSLSHRW